MMNLNALKIDPEFQGKIPPLNFEEEQQLEQNILHEGRLLNPIIIWNGFILDGHTRYRILRKHPFIAYQIQEIELANRYAALSWICQNQLGRRNLDPERKKFLMGKLYESEKLARGGSKERAHDENGRFTSMVQNDPLRAKQLSTCERIAAQNGVGAATVKRAEKYAKGVDAAEDAVPGAREEILTGRIKATDAEITALAKTPKAEIPAARIEMLGQLWDTAHLTIQDIRAHTGLSQAAFAVRYCIPRRTVENWESGDRQCADYVRLLLAEAVGLYTRPNRE